MRVGKKPIEPTGTDWVRVKREVVADAPIPHSPEDGPYDPNDAVAVGALWCDASIKHSPGRPPVTVKRPTLNMRVDADVLAACVQGHRSRLADAHQCMAAGCCGSRPSEGLTVQHHGTDGGWRNVWLVNGEMPVALQVWSVLARTVVDEAEPHGLATS